MAHTLFHTPKAPPRTRRLPRPTAGRIAVFICVILVSVFLTAAGWTLFIGQMAAVENFKGALVTIIVQAGLVVVGPLVLWAYLMLMPEGLLTAIVLRLTKPFKDDPRV